MHIIKLGGITIDKVWTVGEVINWTQDYFVKKSVESPRRTSERLMEWLLDVDKTHLYINWKKELDKEILNQYKLAMKRIVDGEPLAYITGKHHFYAYEFNVNRNVLIPRQETEELVEWILSDNRERDGLKVLDLCTGSGAIGITLARLLKNSYITATDVDSKCIETAVANSKLNEVSDRIEFLCGDFMEPIKDRLNEFDVIVSNPPYISDDEKTLMDKSVLDYEPHKALFGGEDGLDFYRRLYENRDQLRNRTVYLEIGFNQKDRLEKIFSDHEHMFRKDLGGNWRMLRIKF